MRERLTCAESRVLGAPIAGSLAQDEQQHVLSYVEECDTCQRTLDQLAASSWEQKFLNGKHVTLTETAHRRVFAVKAEKAIK
jgi:hypothetical protein